MNIPALKRLRNQGLQQGKNYISVEGRVFLDAREQADGTFTLLSPDPEIGRVTFLASGEITQEDTNPEDLVEEYTGDYTIELWKRNELSHSVTTSMSATAEYCLKQVSCGMLGSLTSATLWFE